ncbi:MAG: hypothetical protein CM15mP44_6480 [Candidatus Neomarinimicrobiota bacterium]|nr:MAG: hypothetical protein CM15mP44_6480 [Candidatus Neomarinimicrobiota bacterium]
MYDFIKVGIFISEIVKCISIYFFDLGIYLFFGHNRIFYYVPNRFLVNNQKQYQSILQNILEHPNKSFGI